MSADFSTAPPDGITGRIIANSGLMGGARAVASILGLGTLIITARALDDPASFGTVLFIHAYMLFFAELASFKCWQAIIRFGSEHLKRKDATNLGRLFRFGFALDALAAIAAYLLAIGLFGAFVAFAHKNPDLLPDLSGISLSTIGNYIGLYCLVLLLRQTSTGTGIFRLFDQFGVLALRALIMPSLRFLGACLAYFMGWGMVGFLCVWFFASAVSYLIIPVLALLELSKRKLLSDVRDAKQCLKRTETGLWPFVLKTNIDSTFGSFRNRFPSLLIMSIFGPALFAIYRIAEEVARFLSRGTKLFDQVLYPELSRLVADGRRRALLGIAVKSALAIFAISLVLIAIVWAFGDHLIEAGLGDGFEGASWLAILLLCAAALTGAAVPFYVVFYVLLKPGRAAWVRGLAIIAYVVTFFATIELSGLFAAGWAAIAGAGIEMIVVSLWASQSIKRYKPRSD